MRTLPQRGHFPPIRALIQMVLERAASHDVGTHAAALTYQALLSAIPLVLLAGSILGMIFAGEPERVDRALDAITGAVPGLEEVVGRSLDALIEERVQAGIIAVVALAWTGSALAARSGHALARIFGLTERRWYRKRLWALLEIMILGALALTGILLTTLTSVGAGPVPWIAGLALDLGVALVGYRLLTPPGGPSLREHLPGAVALAFTWTALKMFGSWYVEVVVTRAAAVYGAIAAVIGLLAILSIAAHAFVYGAEFTAIMRDRPRPAPGSATPDP